jgi:hypothetical protein
MGFTYGVILPGLNRKIWANEITSKLYRDLVKSLYNNDNEAFIQHMFYVVEYVSPGILQEGLNVVDKIVLLLNIRSICISSDLRLKAVCPVTNKEFEHEVRLEDLIAKLKNADYTRTVSHESIQITHSVVKAKDELNFLDLTPERMFSNQLASCIDLMRVNDKHIEFSGIAFKDRLEVIEKLPLVVASKVFNSIVSVEESLSKIKLLKIHSPFADTTVVDFPVTTDTKTLMEFCKLLFNDDLNNLYKINYNLVTKANFTPEYSDNITPAEQLLYWTYFMQQHQKESEDQNRSLQGNNNDPSYGGRKLSGLETPSEFS